MSSATHTVSRYRKLREQALWSLLSAANGPAIIGMLERHLLQDTRTLPASSLHEKIGRDLVELRAEGEDLPRTAESYVAEWVKNGYLERRYPPRALEEVYELSAEATRAIRFVSSLALPRASATASRLETVLELFSSLALETDPDPSARVAAMEAQIAELEAQIEGVKAGRIRQATPDRALEKLLKGSILSQELTEDLRQVRDQFERLNRSLRERLLDTDGSRGEVLNAIFSGVDLIAASEPGKTFAALWRLLMDNEMSSRLEDSIAAVLSRSFAAELPSKDKAALRRLGRSLMERGSAVHEVSQNFARNLKTYVQSREYRETRRLHGLISEAQRAAVDIKDEARPSELIGVTLTLSTARVGSVSQLVLHDPDVQAPDPEMPAAEELPPDLDMLKAMVQQADIDFRLLQANIDAMLARKGQASIGEITAAFPPTQGLGTVLGYLLLAYRQGIPSSGDEAVHWVGTDDVARSTRVPRIHFVKERS